MHSLQGLVIGRRLPVVEAHQSKHRGLRIRGGTQEGK